MSYQPSVYHTFSIIQGAICPWWYLFIIKTDQRSPWCPVIPRPFHCNIITTIAPSYQSRDSLLKRKIDSTLRFILPHRINNTRALVPLKRSYGNLKFAPEKHNLSVGGKKTNWQLQLLSFFRLIVFWKVPFLKHGSKYRKHFLNISSRGTNVNFEKPYWKPLSDMNLSVS